MTAATTDARLGDMRRWLLLGWVLLGLTGSCTAEGAEWPEAQQQFLTGNYTACIATAEKILHEQPDSEDWQLLLSRALLEAGQYPSALTAMAKALEQDRRSVRLRWQARQVFLSNGQTERARQMLEEIIQRASFRSAVYREPASLVVFGQVALLTGSDPKRVLDQVFDTAKKAEPKLRDVYLASGGLALDKHDYALAAKRFEEGLKLLPDDPDLHYGLACAYAPSDSALMVSSIEDALERNSNHVGSLLLLADHGIDAEDYGEAERLLERVAAVNPWHPEAWAYRAVLAHLANDAQSETNARQAALKFWSTNPRVDFLIGHKLSQNYRFAEGADHQRQALQFDPDYLPAKAQLAEDLLRLGQEEEGWKLAQEVQQHDAYDVQAYNLVTLHDTMGKFATLTNEDFILRMGAREASIYGARVLALLGQARSNLCAKYGQEVQRPTIVEVFPEQKDFAVRTFGMPGNPGYLGVCFGSVITANSSAAHPGHDVNWEAVLWHEFCHVVTLQMTQNKMPRWLSEGISVYEEMQANPAWGQRMDPSYREMVLGDDLVPVSKLSAAFLAPKSDLHLQFAYYESSLVVDYLVQRFGLAKLKAILHDLGDGLEINQAIQKHTAPLAKIEAEFSAFARERAEKLAPGLDWERPEFDKGEAKPGRRGREPRPQRRRAGGTEEQWQEWARTHPTNFWVMVRGAQEHAEKKQWSEAKSLLERLIALYPDFTGEDSAYRFLAAAHRALGETNAERKALAVLAEKDSKATDAYMRLMELASQEQEWPTLSQNALRYLAVNPLVAQPYRYLLEASERKGELGAAIDAARALLALDPVDPAQAHFQLAQLLRRAGEPEARRQVLQALEEAPRFRAALRLLLDINADSPQAKAVPPGSEAK